MLHLYINFSMLWDESYNNIIFLTEIMSLNENLS